MNLHTKVIFKNIISSVLIGTTVIGSFPVSVPVYAAEVLTCTQQEHIHSDSCYKTKTSYVCGYHVHGSSCYAEGTLICELEADPEHAHEDSCKKTEKVLNCKIKEHTHSESCYKKEESSEEDSSKTEENTKEDQTEETGEDTEKDDSLEETEEKELTEEELEELKRLEEEERLAKEEEERLKKEEEEKLLQEKLEKEKEEKELLEKMKLLEMERENTDDDDTTGLIPKGNPKADLESRKTWEKTFADVKLTGVLADDVIAIAESQLGYHESTRNYVITRKKKKKGITRYGQWYGIPYGDWCAMFVSFCLHYAGVDQVDRSFPLDAGCNNWIVRLTSRDEYRRRSQYTPVKGDLIFFNWDSIPDADHVGLVVDVVEKEDGMYVKTIEGNTSDCVAYRIYPINDKRIMGYGILPTEETEVVEEILEEVSLPAYADIEEPEEFEVIEEEPWIPTLSNPINIKAILEELEMDETRLYASDDISGITYDADPELSVYIFPFNGLF